MLDEILSGKTRVIDLSYAINEKLVPWPGDEKWFEAKVNASVEKNGYFTRSFWMLEHYGTHLDAPAHFAPGKATVDQIPAKQLFGLAAVLDVRADAAKDADYQLPAARVEEWEKRHGRIPAGAIVLLRTGWASRWPDAQRYRNQDAQGEMHFPGFSVESAKMLIERSQRLGMRYDEHRLRRFGGLCGAPPDAGFGAVSSGESRGLERVAGNRSISGGGAHQAGRRLRRASARVCVAAVRTAEFFCNIFGSFTSHSLAGVVGLTGSPVSQEFLTNFAQ